MKMVKQSMLVQQVVVSGKPQMQEPLSNQSLINTANPLEPLLLIRKTQILFMLQHGNSEDNLIRSTPADREVVFIKVWMEENRGRNLPMDFLQSLLVG